MADFTWQPSYPAANSMKPRLIKTQFGDGYEQVAADGINSALKSWNLTFNNRSTTEAAAIMAFLKSKGGWKKFTFTDPDGETLNYRCNTWSDSNNTGNQHTITATFYQVP